MFSNLLLKFGWSRDDYKWIIFKITAVAGILSAHVIDIPYWGAYLGIKISTVGVHWIEVVSIVILWLAGQYDSSSLPGKKV